MTDAATDFEAHLQRELSLRLMGMEEVIHALCIAVLARGHVMLEGPPGLGKTRLGKGFAEVLGGSFKRIQGTADLMPTDITGVHIYNSQTQQFEFQLGPVFADIVLVDELNRAGPKTQSALLEAMEERQVSVDRESFALSDDFLVIATRNPQEFEGTFPLPESQLDRFSLCVPVGYLEPEHEAHVLETYNLPAAELHGEAPLQPVDPTLLASARESIGQVHLSRELIDYVLNLAAATRNSVSIGLGLSVRGALTLVRAARIEAALRGGDFVAPDDVKAVFDSVVTHRLQLTPEAAIEGISAREVIAQLLDHVAVPR